MTPDRLWLTWNTNPLILFSLMVVAWTYGRGAQALWRVAGHGRGVRSAQVAAFAGGFFSILVALVSPLDPLSEQLFSAHMVQHLVLVTIAAPLISLGHPALALLWAWPRAARVSIGRALACSPALSRVVRLGRKLAVAFGLHSLALWAWHAPVLYEGALRHTWLHATEHLVLLGTGIMFWSAAWAELGRARGAAGTSILFVFALGLQCTGLGALITFAARPWYALYAQTAPVWDISAMDDQVLAGVLMWVLAGLVYLMLALVLLIAWLRPPPHAPAPQSGKSPPSPLSQNR